jgi:hypothetical protein
VALTPSLTSLHVDQRTIAQPALARPPLPQWLAVMRMNAHSACCSTSLGIDADAFDAVPGAGALTDSGYLRCSFVLLPD